MTRTADAEPLDRLVDAVVVDGERFGVVAGLLDTGRTPTPGGLTATVPWVPAWTARDLVVHLGTVHRWVTGILRAGAAGDRSAPAPQQLPAGTLAGPELHGWFATGLTELVATLRTTDPAQPTWHMSPTAATAADWVHRQASEHLVHRLDLEATAGLAHAPVDPALAADGIEEALGVMIPRWAHTEPLVRARAEVRVLATDVDRGWDVGVQAGQLTLRAAGSAGPDPDAELSGAAHQVLLRLWGRPARVQVRGNRAAEALLRGR